MDVGASLSGHPVKKRILRLLRNEQVIISLLAALTGVSAGCGSIGFRELIGMVQSAGFGSLGGQLTAAAAGAVLGAPISTTLIVFELTGDYGITISLMVAVAIATLITQWLCGKSFFHWQLSRRGYDLSEGPQGIILKTMRVRDVMEKMPPGSPLPASAERLETMHSLGEALAKLNEAEEHGLPVVDAKESDQVVGYLSRVKALAAYNKALIEENIEHHT